MHLGRGDVPWTPKPPMVSSSALTIALYQCSFGDHDGRGAYLSLDVIKNSLGPMANNLANEKSV
jgi:hypothetical protein